MAYVSSVPGHEIIEQQQLEAEAARFEFGWSEVRRGLGLILRSYFVAFLISILVAGGLVFILMPGENGKPRFSSLAVEASLMIAVAVMGLGMIYSYGCLIAGHWRCMMYAPERHWARWLMFFCILAVVAGPAINFVMGPGGIKKYPKKVRTLEDLEKIELTHTAIVSQVVGFSLNVASLAFFMLFLRAIGTCFQDGIRTLFVDLYLLLFGITLGMTLFLALGSPDPAMVIPLLIGVGAGWVLLLLGYLILIAVMRGCISSGLARIRSPLSA